MSGSTQVVEIPWTYADTGIRAIEISADGSSIVMGTNTSTHLIKDNRPVWDRPFGGNVVTISADGGRVIIAGGDYFVRSFDINGSAIWQYDPGATIKRLVVTPDGRWLGIASGKVIQMLNEVGKVAWEHDLGDSVLALRLTPDGSNALAATNNTLFQLTGGRVEWESQMDFEIRDITIVPNGAIVAAGIKGDEVCYFRVP